MLRSKVNKFTSISSIRCTNSLEKCLGFPIFRGRASKDKFLFIIEKLQHRLAAWKHNMLNKAGRLALPSSVMASIPSYYMQLFWLPQGTCSQIDRLTRDFLWKGNEQRGLISSLGTRWPCLRIMEGLACVKLEMLTLPC